MTSENQIQHPDFQKPVEPVKRTAQDALETLDEMDITKRHKNDPHVLGLQELSPQPSADFSPAQLSSPDIKAVTNITLDHDLSSLTSDTKHPITPNVQDSNSLHNHTNPTNPSINDDDTMMAEPEINTNQTADLHVSATIVENNIMSSTSQKLDVETSESVSNLESNHNQPQSSTLTHKEPLFTPPSSEELNRSQIKYAATVLKNVKKLKDAYLFLSPVDPIKLNIPQYPEIIKRPMDLSTVQKKIDQHEYLTFQAFHDDVELIFANCIKFNGPESFAAKMALSVQTSYRKLADKLPIEVKVEPKKKKSIDIRPDSVVEAPRPKREVSQSYASAPWSPTPKKKTGRKNPAEVKFCGTVIRDVMNKKNLAINYPFVVPVDPIAMGIPQYNDIIKNPMDLSTIKKRLDTMFYDNADEFEEDFHLMLNNCFTFNQPEDDVYQIGKRLESYFVEKMAAKPTSMPNRSKGDGDSDDEEYENSQIVLLQQNLALMSSQLAVLMDKRRKRKERRKNEAIGLPTQPSMTKPVKKSTKKEDKIPEITFEMKKEISEKINFLSQDKIVQVFQIIREGVPSLGAKADEEEIELDIDSLDKKTLYKLHKFIQQNGSGKNATNAHKAAASDSDSSSDED